ncbi:F-box protein [Phytophthora cinnamomi]|uniref:F-box protein n=1 Tax=Phytophthora cinnamomi TaxID=4785 RepID=UPI00355A800F|nr:F-box protein [Phytophthora cinnamomi]
MAHSAAASGADAAVGVDRTIELLAPVYADVCPTTATSETRVPVTLQRTADDWLQLAFSRPNVRKDAACVNGASGCRCDFVRFLRALLLLSERLVLRVHATYVVAAGQAPVATLQLRVRVHDEAKHGTALKDFDLVLCHLQATVLSIVPRNEQAREEALSAALEQAKNSSCHVVGCRLHPWDTDKQAQQPKQKLNLPDVFHSLTSQMEVDQMEIRDDATYVARMTRANKQILLTDLPTNVLQSVVCLMNARDLASLSGVCSLFQHMAYEVVPGLNLVLYEHQRRGLKWMLRRETPSLTCIPQPHPFILSSESENDIITISSSSSDEEELKETSDNDDEQDDIEATRMVQNARRRWAKRRSIIAAMSSSDDDDDNNEVKPPPLKAMATVNGKLNGNGIVRRETKVSSKAKAVSFAIIDDDDSDTESE